MTTGDDPDPPPHARLSPPAFLAAPAPRAVLAALPGARAVGGCVRDALAGRPVADIDIAAPLPPEAIAARLRAAGLRVFETGLDHGTVTAVLGEQPPVEVTALRRDVATDGRHAQVEWTTDWREDAARRDFTINAMSLSAAGGLWDWFGGREDLARGRVRFVGDPAMRLAEDYLRALRFFRFHARYGRPGAPPDAAALAAIRAAVPGLARLSAERVWMELKRLLATPDPTGALALMAETGVLAAVLPEAGMSTPSAPSSALAGGQEHASNRGGGVSAGRGASSPPPLSNLARLVGRGAPAEPLLRLAALLPRDDAAAAAVAARLRFSGEEADRLRAVLEDAAPDPDLDGADLRRALAVCDAATLTDRAWLAEAHDGRDRAPLRARIAATPRPVFPLQGRDALALGLAPGPRIGALLGAVRAWWLAGGCVADAAACRAELARRAKELPSI